jgi:hypothetical protein
MNITFILLGLFLWFVLAFNGGIGETFVNYSLFSSALFMIISGVLAIFNSTLNIARIFCALALTCYAPVIWQRFNFSSTPDWGGLSFDVVFIVLMIIFIIRNPNKSSKPESS